MADEDHKSVGGNVKPVNYSLVVDTNLKTFRFRGKLVIKVKVRESANEIALYAKELEIKGVTVRTKQGEQKATWKHDPVHNILTIKFKEGVSGDAELLFDYIGVNNDRLYGFYRSSYEFKGKKGYMLTTHLEAPNARALLPCFDEPEFKATFDVTVILDKELDAISNMPVKSIKKMEKGRKAVAFQTTPIMSTYLLYIGVGRFEYLNGKAGHINVRIVTVPGKKALASLPMEYAKSVVQDYEKYFGIKYPLPKLDFIAVPDFSAGAMENWGAITFREADLLGDAKETPVAARERIAEVIAHELAHQWFGDLVTMRWWDDMWLNESFATYMENKSLNRLYPEWKEMEKYYNDTISGAFAADSLRNTHPIRVKVDTVEEIEELFDAIGYNKGGSVLFMLENYVGSEPFRKGLHNYLKAHSYSNATSTDLWDAIQMETRRSGKNPKVTEIMQDWITRAGYPIINVTKDVGDAGFTIEQEKFTISGTEKGERWKIPVSYLTSEGEGKILLDAQSARIHTKSEWIKLNYRQTGFYRVRYDSYNLARLGKLYRAKQLGDVDAWGMEADLFALARSGMVKARDYITFISRYCMDSGYPLNMNISGHINWIVMKSYNEPFGEDIRKFSIRYHKHLLESVGPHPRENESTINKKLRASAIASLSFAGEKEVRWKLEGIFERFVNKNEKIDPDLRDPIFTNAAMFYGDQKKFDAFVNLYLKDPLPDVRIDAITSLPMFKDPVFVRKALDLAFTSKVRLQDSIILLGSARGNPCIGNLYWEWMREHWKQISDLYGDPSSHMLKSAVAFAGSISDRKARDEFKAFFSRKENMRSDINREALKALEAMDANIRFMEVNRGAVLGALPEPEEPE